MAAATIALLTLAVSAGTAGIGIQQQRSAAKSASKASSAIAAENDKIRALQKRQGLLENARLRRKARRASIIERARGEQAAVTAGIPTRGGSTLPGILGSSVSELGDKIGAIGQNDQIAGGVFDAQAAIGRLRDSQGQATASRRTGQGLTSLGGAILSNLPEIVRVGTTIGGPKFTTTVRNV